jgi:hypothetical protein
MSCKSCYTNTDVVTPSNNIDISVSNTSGINSITNNTTTGMNNDNRKVIVIAAEKGVDEAVKHMFNPTGEKQLTYAEMRERYG